MKPPGSGDNAPGITIRSRWQSSLEPPAPGGEATGITPRSRAVSGTAGAIVASGVTAQLITLSEICPACGCRSRSPVLSALFAGNLDYCRNCGACLPSGRFDVAGPRLCAGADCLRVPFPDHRFVEGSTKPNLDLSQLKF